jgi:hypothetical protein
LTAYYAAAFKTGQYPQIQKDKIIMWSRTHPSQATAPDPVGRPDNFELVRSSLSVLFDADLYNTDGGCGMGGGDDNCPFYCDAVYVIDKFTII